MKLNDYITTAEGAEALGITKGYFTHLAKQRNWQSIMIGRSKLWLKVDVCSFLAESLTLREQTYHTTTLRRMLGVSPSRIRAIAKRYGLIQVQWSRWLKSDWKPILEKRGVADE